ncbi:MAG TPA: VWA domain-containing protein [Rudaea sp.]|jgi:Ca-activated chloride channel family protein
MTLLGDFHFVRPFWLLALLALPLVWLALRRSSGEAQAWRGAVDAHLLRHLLERDERTRASSPHWLVAVAWLLACIALAGPAWERLPMPLFQNRAARVIALELAPTMLSQDVKPTRAARARYKIVDILRRSRDAQTALIAYSGDAFVVAPLTDDSNTVENLVDALEPSIMPVSGNDTARAIEMGTRLIAQAGLHDGEIIVVADSVSGGAAAAASKARAAGVRVSVLGIGTSQGAPIATASGGFLKDTAGNIAMPKLDSSALTAVAAAGGGRYADYSGDARDLDAVLDDLRPQVQADAAPGNAQTARFLDRGPWLLLLLVPMAAFGFRRGWLMLLPLVMLLQPQRADAMSWVDLWSRPDQQAQAALDAGDAKQAQALARDPQLHGSAAYRAEDFAAAAQDFDRPDSAEAQYNLGNALARQKKFPQALAAYDRALKQQPDMDDASANRKAVEDWLKKQKQQGKGGKEGKEGDKKDEQRQSNGGSDSEHSDDDQQQRADNQSGEQKDGDDKSAQNRQGSDQQSGKPQDDQDGQSAGESQGQKDASAAKSNHDNDKSDMSKAAAQPESKSAEQNAQEQFQKSMDQALKNGSEPKEKRPLRLGAREDGGTHNEKEQAVEQWLQRVPDDPGGLLRRKFQLEAQRRQQAGANGDLP